MSARTATANPQSPQGDNKATRHKPILAERFKTKMCRTFVETGSCPYEERCMFAHGDADLRSKEMNLADKLTTEEAIRAFQRTLREKNLAAAATSTDSFKPSPTQASPTSSVTTTTTTTTMKAKAQVAELDPLRLASPASDSPANVPATAPPTPDASSAVKGLRFVSALCAPALGRHGETQQTPTAQTPCAADERVSSPSSAGCASGVHRHPAGPLDLSLSGDSEGFVAKEARSPAVRPVANNSKRYRHDPYAPVVFGMPLQNQYFTAGPVYCDPVAVAAPLMMPVTAPLVKVVVGVATPPQKALAPTVTVPTLSTYGPKTTYAAIAAQGRHEVLLA